MDPNQDSNPNAGTPAVSDAPIPVGENVFDEGVYICTACNIPGCETSLMPGDAAPDCPHCGTEARWVKA